MGTGKQAVIAHRYNTPVNLREVISRQAVFGLATSIGRGWEHDKRNCLQTIVNQSGLTLY